MYEFDSSKLTPIHHAVIRNHVEMVQLLLEYHADVNRRDIVIKFLYYSLEELHSFLESVLVMMIVSNIYSIIKQFLGLIKRISTISIWICLMTKLEINIERQKM